MIFKEKINSLIIEFEEKDTINDLNLVRSNFVFIKEIIKR